MSGRLGSSPSSRNGLSAPADQHPGAHRALVAGAALAGAGVCVWVAWLLGAFELMTTVTVDGRTWRIPNTFATVDHPFHATRGDTLLQSLRQGEMLRWVAHHHGGYPVEFYPLGVAWLDVALWAVFLGMLPVVALHKLAVIVIFLLPAVAFWMLARGDRLNPMVAVLALVIHVAVPGEWTNGGYLELVEWGLAANVGGATLALVTLAALGRHVVDGGRWFAVVAALAASGALYTNMRSGIAVAVGALAILLAVLLRPNPSRQVEPVMAVLRIGAVALLAMLLTAPLLLSMARYADFYFFVHFMEYATFADYRESVIASVSWWFLAPALGMALLALVVPHLTLSRAVALSAILYAGLTVVLSRGGMEGGLIQQLETPRLMPFQRLVTIYLAAAGIGWLADRLARMVFRSPWRERVVAAGLAAIALVTTLAFPGTFNPLPVDDLTAPVGSHTTGVPEFAAFTQILRQAEEIRPEGTALFVIGDQESWWHEQLWAPVETDAQAFYDDWMWYWHPDRPGPYDYEQGHYFPDPAAVLTGEWLGENAIGVVVVTNMRVPAGAIDPREAAADNPLLEYQGTVGYWDLYRVREPLPLVTNGDLAPVSVIGSNHRIEVTFDDAGGVVEIRRNWFPRWEAFADGVAVPVERRADGYMEVTVPEGTRSLELRYAVTLVDWLGRVASLAGVIMVMAIATGLPARLLRRPYASSRAA